MTDRRTLEQTWDEVIPQMAAEMRKSGTFGMAIAAKLRASIAAWQQQNGGGADD